MLPHLWEGMTHANLGQVRGSDEDRTLLAELLLERKPGPIDTYGRTQRASQRSRPRSLNRNVLSPRGA